MVPAMHPIHPYHGCAMPQGGVPAAMVAQQAQKQVQPAAQMQSVQEHAQVQHPMQCPMQMQPMQYPGMGCPNMAMAAMQRQWQPDDIATPVQGPAEPTVQSVRQHGEEQRRHWNAKTAQHEVRG